MQQTKLLRLMLMSLLAISALFYSLNASSKNDHDEIPLRKQSGSIINDGSPRSLDTSIIAFYDSDLSCVCAFLTNAGTPVSVEILNQTTNETDDYIIPGSGSSFMPISGSAGYWTITFTLEGGDIYYGEFVL